jgi:predicted nucleic acid-binding protein
VSTVVLDASVEVGWLLPDEPWHAAALSVAGRIAEGSLEAIVAPNTRFEVCNALVKAARRRRIGWHRVAVRIAELDAISIRVHAEPLGVAAVLAVCQEYRLGWGDAHHALLAQRLNLPLMTADQRLVRALQGSDIWVESILDQPADGGAAHGDQAG